MPFFCKKCLCESANGSTCTNQKCVQHDGSAQISSHLMHDEMPIIHRGANSSTCTNQKCVQYDGSVQISSHLMHGEMPIIHRGANGSACTNQKCAQYDGSAQISSHLEHDEMPIIHRGANVGEPMEPYFPHICIRHDPQIHSSITKLQNMAVRLNLSGKCELCGLVGSFGSKCSCGGYYMDMPEDE